MGNPILPRAPLILVLAEVNFSTILSISKKIAEIQECLRHVGFPEFETVLEEPDSELPHSEPEHNWRFGARDNLTAIVISDNTITLETSKYLGFDNFTENLKQVLDLFSEIARPSLLKGINLRYIDLIRDLDGTKAEQLINTPFIKLDHLPTFQSHYQYESVQFATAEGIVRINLMKSCDDTTVPLDIDPAVLIPTTKTADDIILDLNHIAIFEETDFSTAQIMDAFQRIHDQDVKPAFESIVTPFAIEQWGKEKTS